ncbi:tRNA (adenosine(37)-N6)-threonylcarbamoyltransferase complex transferase subunit TsaD [Patescibacteria group bacterium]|nr:tRNA (adenosine(37)-N6)-threonylcarbamoyltransferase complex transferase subunit TsaD [Patescibacteria group bacterium]
MRILGIETSCDETAAAIVEDGTKIVSNVVASSQAMHAKFGGIIPEQAAREQLASMIPVLKEAMITDFDAIAVTIGPGLIGSLLVGVETAKALALAWKKPLIPVNHLIGHIYANWLTGTPPVLPAMVLLVSGGHSELILMRDHSNIKYLGGTRDDAAGECFDKCARLLDLGYPGGPAVEKAAESVKRQALSVKLPRPMINEKNLDFSFSGLKTAVSSLYASRLTPNSKEIAYELQEAVTDVLVRKTLQAAEKYQVKSVLLAGGVAANKRLREKLQSTVYRLPTTVTLHVPPIQLCTDNAAYIASAAYFNQKTAPWQQVDANPALDLI